MNKSHNITPHKDFECKNYFGLEYLWQLAPNTHDGSSLGNEQFLKPPKIEMVGVVKIHFLFEIN